MGTYSGLLTRYRWLKSKELPLIQILVGGDAALSRPKRVTDISVMTIAHSNFILILSNTNKGPSNTKPKEIIIPLKLKRPQ